MHIPKHIKGDLFSLFAFFFMALFGTLIKAAALGDSAPWGNFIAYLVGSIILLTFVFKEGGFKFLKTKHFFLHFCRAFFGVFASLAYICSIRYIPLLDATLLFNATPLFIPIFAFFLMKARPPLETWLSIVLGFIGITLIIHPSASIFEHPGDLLGLASGISLAVAFVCIKMLTRTDPYMHVLFYFFFLATLIQLPLLPWYGPFPPLNNVLIAAASGVALLVAQWGIVKSYSLAPVAEVGTFQYSAVVFVGLFDWIFWGARPTLLEIAGAAIVVIAGIVIITHSKKAYAHKIGRTAR